MDLSLDDIISKKRSAKRPRGSKAQNPLKRTSGGRIQKRKSNSSPGNQKRNLSGKWQHDMFASVANGDGASASDRGNVRIIISNLDFGVSDEDIQELFQEFGTLRRAFIHYDRSGRSLGTAEVVYTNRADAAKAIAQYNGLPLDGRPMQISLVSPSDAIAAAPVRSRIGNDRGNFGRREGPASRTRGGAGAKRGGSGRGRGRRGNREQRPPVTKDQLDAELAAYTAQVA